MVEAVAAWPEDQRNQRGGESEIGNKEPQRQEQQVEPVRLDVVVVMQAMLQPPHEGDRRRPGVEGEAVHEIFAAVEQQRADDDVERAKRREAEADQRDERQRADASAAVAPWRKNVPITDALPSGRSRSHRSANGAARRAGARVTRSCAAGRRTSELAPASARRATMAATLAKGMR